MGDHNLRFPAVERRTIPFEDFEVRDEGGELRFDGIAAVTGTWTELFPGMRERIAKGAFRKVLSKQHDVRLLVDHDPSKVLARSTISDGPGSLSLKEEARGLRAQAIFSDTTVGRDTAQLLRDGVVNQMSFAWPFGATRDEVREDESGSVDRTITEFRELRDVSVVSYPAYPTTSAAMRSLEYGRNIDFEELRRIATDVHNGDLVVTDEERRLIDEAFARMDSLSPWMEELARRVLGSSDDARTASQGAEEEEAVVPAVDSRQSAVARTRRLTVRSKLMAGGSF